MHIFSWSIVIEYQIGSKVVDTNIWGGDMDSFLEPMKAMASASPKRKVYNPHLHSTLWVQFKKA